jgi:hypothetical protein
MTLLVEIALIVVAALGLLVCLSLVPAHRSAGTVRPALSRPSRPDQLIALERLVSAAQVSTLEVHAHLRPVLVEIVSRRLAGRGQRLDAMSEPAARQVLGDGLWELVRPDRPFPEDRRALGLPAEELRAMLAALERL